MLFFRGKLGDFGNIRLSHDWLKFTDIVESVA